MKIYFSGWFSGFFEKTNPGLHVTFFLELFEKVYSEPCHSASFEECDILCEFDMLINTTTALQKKKWKHSFLFSGESSLKCKKELYTCVLWGERNHKNVVNLPLFVAYTYTHGFLPVLKSKAKKNIDSVPPNDVCVIISNPGGETRNTFLNELEKNMHVCYAGRYRNNIGGNSLPFEYNTKEFLKFVGQFKFIVSMENSKEDTYITEKIVHGMLAQTIPIYWGSDRVHDYFNPSRFICLQEDNIQSTVREIVSIRDDNTKWLQMVNTPVFTNDEFERTIDFIARDIRCVLRSDGCWKNIDQVFCVCNPEFEPERYELLKKLFMSQNIHTDNVHYISSTYKHTITEDIYNNNIQDQLVLRLRRNPMKKGELSLFLNYKQVLEYVVKNYKDGNFLIFESDVMLSKDISQFNDFMDAIKDKDWGLIHLGSYDSQIMGDPNMKSPTGYRNRHVFQSTYIEDISNIKDIYRLFRKYHTRCCDSFLWRYNSIQVFLKYMNDENNFGVPFDYYLCNFFENHNEIKHYWSKNEFFKQGSNLGLMKTTLQNNEG
jgi:hypothetical protein